MLLEMDSSLSLGQPALSLSGVLFGLWAGRRFRPHDFRVRSQAVGWLERQDNIGSPKPGSVLPHVPAVVNAGSSSIRVIEFLLCLMLLFRNKDDGVMLPHPLFLDVAEDLFYSQIPGQENTPPVADRNNLVFDRSHRKRGEFLTCTLDPVLRHPKNNGMGSIDRIELDSDPVPIGAYGGQPNMEDYSNLLIGKSLGGEFQDFFFSSSEGW